MWFASAVVEAATAAIALRLELPGGGHVEIGAASAQGPRRQNQDCFLVMLPSGQGWLLRDGRLTQTMASQAWTTAPTGGTWLRLAVLDGVGGHAGGGIAAEDAAARLAAAPPAASPHAMRAMVRRLHDDMVARLGGIGITGTTLVLADIDLDSQAVTVTTVGDSRAWLGHRSTIHQLTRDHRTAEFAYRDGEIGWSEYLRTVATKTNRLAQALGFGSHGAMARTETALNPGLRIDLAEDLPEDRSQHADAFSIALGDGSSLVLGTDGLLLGPALEEDFLRGVMTSGRSLCAAVHHAATSPRATDNATAAILRFRPV